MPENARRDVLNARGSEEDSPSEILVIYNLYSIISKYIHHLYGVNVKV